MIDKTVAALSGVAFLVIPCIISCSHGPPGAVNPDPADGATNVDLFTTLSWETADIGGDSGMWYDVYFGTDQAPPLVADGLSTTSYDPGMLDRGTTYYWKVDTRDTDGTTPGNTWRFTTHSELCTGYCSYMPMDVGNKWVYDRNVDGSVSEFTCEVLSAAGEYDNFDAYAIEQRDNGDIVREFYGGCDGDKSYLYDMNSEKWLYHIADEMELNSVTDTGLIERWAAMEYTDNEDKTVPAGTFEYCKVLYMYTHTGGWPNDEHSTWSTEYYAKDVGLVWAEYKWEHVSWIIFFPVTTSGSTTYVLTDYEIHHEPITTGLTATAAWGP